MHVAALRDHLEALSRPILFCFVISKFTMLMNSSHHTMTPKSRTNPLHLTLVLREQPSFKNPKFLGAGYGMETSNFKEPGIERVALYNNDPSSTSVGSGLKEEGRKRRYNWVDGHWDDMMCTYAYI
jgi:hypothetical protein